jgi:DNA polymerase I-like protein with 3'-5' exonuclease and polymerase domains
MSCWGLTVDEEAVDNLTKQLKDEVSSEMTEFKRLGLYREKGTKNMAIVKERVEEAYYAMGKDCPCTKTGPSTSKRTLMESGDPVLQRLAEIGATQKLLNTFIPVLNLGMGGGSIHPGYDTLKETGRTSSFKPNIQQLPRKGGIRECFIPRPGYVFIAADYSVAELCSLAQVLLDVFGTSKMADALKQGKDLHINTAASIMNMDYDKCMRLYKEGDPKVEDIRQTSKVLNFGLPGGLGAKGFVGYAAGFGLTVTYGEATRLRSKWLSEYPEMELYFKWISDQMGTGGSFTSTHPITGFMRGNVGYCDGANHQFQHLTATGAKIALFNIANECYVNKGTDLFGCRPVAFIHDEVLMEAPIANAHESALRLTKLMEEGMSEVLKDIHCAAEATMMRRWYKGAKPVYENGRLVPWEPKK